MNEKLDSKTPATLAVDVLAQMDAAVASFMEMGWSQDSHPMQEAHAAVAELIEAANYLKRDASNDQWAAFHAALSRVKGESA